MYSITWRYWRNHFIKKIKTFCVWNWLRVQVLFSGLSRQMRRNSWVAVRISRSTIYSDTISCERRLSFHLSDEFPPQRVSFSLSYCSRVITYYRFNVSNSARPFLRLPIKIWCKSFAKRLSPRVLRALFANHHTFNESHDPRRKPEKN